MIKLTSYKRYNIAFLILSPIFYFIASKYFYNTEELNYCRAFVENNEKLILKTSVLKKIEADWEGTYIDT